MTSAPAPDAAFLDRALDVARRAARAAAAIIDGYYRGGAQVMLKPDATPVTQADIEAEAAIRAVLREAFPDHAIHGEEAGREGEGDFLWLVDPLDGTKEFLSRNGEFTVNIALIEDGVPVLGVVHAPVLDYLVHARRGVGCWLREANVDRDMALATRRPAQAPLRVAASRSHLDARTARALDAIGEHARMGLGSSLKFCRIAEGCADVYPRFGPTSEWDTAAGQCVLEAAGGAVLGLDGQPLRYNRGPSLLNPDFIALGDADLPWKAWIDGLDG